MRVTVTSSIAGPAARRRRVATAVILTVGLLSFLVMGATAASASCARQPTIEESLARAELVFVGTAVEVTNSSRWATFAVEDIWKGQVDGGRVEIRGGPREGVGTSTDREYLLDTRYLVFAMPPPTEPPRLGLYGEGVRWTDNGCSLTQPYTSSLRDARPATARSVGAPPQAPSIERPPAVAPQEPAIERPDSAAPRSAEAHGDRPPFDAAWPFALVVVAVGGAGAVGLRLRRRQRFSTRR